MLHVVLMYRKKRGMYRGIKKFAMVTPITAEGKRTYAPITYLITNENEGMIKQVNAMRERQFTPEEILWSPEIEITYDTEKRLRKMCQVVEC